MLLSSARCLIPFVSLMLDSSNQIFEHNFHLQFVQYFPADTATMAKEMIAIFRIPTGDCPCDDGP